MILVVNIQKDHKREDFFFSLDSTYFLCRLGNTEFQEQSHLFPLQVYTSIMNLMRLSIKKVDTYSANNPYRNLRTLIASAMFLTDVSMKSAGDLLSPYNSARGCELLLGTLSVTRNCSSHNLRKLISLYI